MVIQHSHSNIIYHETVKQNKIQQNKTTYLGTKYDHNFHNSKNMIIHDHTYNTMQCM